MASGQQFNLRWNNHTNNILQVFMEHLSCENLVDVTLSCQGQFLKAHKMILSACSPYFQEIFSHHQHQQHPVIIINGMKFVDIKLVVEFMYRGEIKVLETELDGLLAAAEALQVKGLSNVRNKYEKGDILGAENHAVTQQSSQQQQQSGVAPLSPLHTRRKRRRLSESSPNSDGPAHSDALDNSVDVNSTRDESSEAGKDTTFVSVPMNAYVEDEEFPRAIKVEPPDIRDIDEGDASDWEASKLVIDVPDGKENNTKIDLSPVKGVTRANKNAKIGSPSEYGRARNLDYGQPPPQQQPQIAAGSTNIEAEEGVLATIQPKRAAQWLRRRVPDKDKIPRPPNAFMIFANEWRRKLAFQHPNESNKEISVRLGIMWKNLSFELKESYYAASRVADREHKIKYPGYYYSPKEARMRKTLKQDLALARKNSKAVEAMHLVKVLMAEANNDHASASADIEDSPRTRKEQRKRNSRSREELLKMEHTAVRENDDDFDSTIDLKQDVAVERDANKTDPSNTKKEVESEGEVEEGDK